MTTSVNATLADHHALPSALAAGGTAALLDAVCERMIPPTSRWPAASALGLGAALERHLRESEWTALLAALDRLGPDGRFLGLAGEEQDTRIAALESEHPEHFRVLRQLLYLGYYAQPAVVAVFRNLGFDVNDTPQPHGYAMAPFDLARVPAAGPGVFIPTGQVVRVAGAWTGADSSAGTGVAR